MQTITLQLRRLGKRKVQSYDYTLPTVGTGAELVAACVGAEVERYNRERTERALLPFLSPAEIQAGAESGKIGFGEKLNRTPADVETSVATAFQAHTDGLFMVFHNDDEVSDLAAPLHLTDGDTVAFVRLTFLTGTYW